MKTLNLKMAALLLSTAFGISAHAAMKNVTVTNLTSGQPLTPPVIIVHSSGQSFFGENKIPSNALALLAEEGLPDGFLALEGSRHVKKVYVGAAPIMPGETGSVMISVSSGQKITVLSMLGTTNDGFTGLDAVSAPKDGYFKQYSTVAYDAGTEQNTELCAHIPGPPCNSHGARVTAAEGLTQKHQGIQGVGDLDPTVFGWTGPVAKIRIESAD